MLASIYLPIFIGAVLGAVGSLIFIMQSRAFSGEGATQGSENQQSAVRRVLVIYAAISWACLVAAVFIGSATFIVLTVIIAALASAGLVLRWSS